MRHRSPSGFTLVEMSVVMVVMGLVMLAVFPALSAVRSSSQRALTQSNLHNLMLATASYVQANGCLPCPASAATSGANFGRMPYASATIACGNCPAAEGIVPFVTLGISAAAAHDGWGHWITMRVDPALTAQFNVAPPTASCQCNDFVAPNLPSGCVTGGVTATPGCSALGVSQKGMCQPNLSASNTYIKVTTPFGGTQRAAVIFVSHGEDGYGSCFAQPRLNANNGFRLPFPAGFAACSANGGYAQCNAAAGASSCATTNAQFYDAPTVVSETDAYDDMLAYADRNTLISMLGNPGCQTVW